MVIRRAARHASRRIAALTAAVAAAGLLVTAGMAGPVQAGPVQAGSAHASAVSITASRPKPSIVLIHGAWADSSSWDAVVSELQHDGYTVYVPPNPLLGISYDSAYIRDFLPPPDPRHAGADAEGRRHQH
jgi:pimeloyl-ACP methyl ester carboxylesterase